jgi:hypothetical protein
MKSWIIYLLFRPYEPIEPIYVGIGKRSWRPFVHSSNARGNRPATDFSNPYLISTIRKALRLGLETPVIVMRRHLSYENVCACERALIAALGRRDLKTGPLLNLTAGGEGKIEFSELSKAKIMAVHKGAKRSNESRQRMREAQLLIDHHNIHNFGARQKMSVASIAYWANPEHRIKQRNRVLGRKRSASAIFNMRMAQQARREEISRLNTGRKASDQTKAKMVEARKRWWKQHPEAAERLRSIAGEANHKRWSKQCESLAGPEMS